MNADLIIFFVVCAVLLALVITVLLAPFWRNRAPDTGADTDMDIYRAQLNEVDRDLARGVLDQTEAERTRTEISRRLLSADANMRAQSSSAPKGASLAVAALVAISLSGGAAALYLRLGAVGYGDVPRAVRIAAGENRRENRPSQLDAEAARPESDAILSAQPETAEILQALRAAAFERPNEIQAWAYLAQTEASIGNMQRAARAQEQTISMLGAQTTSSDLVRLLDFLVIGTGGYVSPEAETIAVRVLQTEPDNMPALYYAGLLYAQNDRPDRAFNLWRQVIENGEENTLHWTFAADQIEAVAAQLGIDYALPNARGPSDEDLAAAENMAPEDRATMIQGMVSQLANRLATQGGPPQDWARLISSLAVIGERDTARTVLAEAEAIFGGDIQAVTLVRRAAQNAGVLE